MVVDVGEELAEKHGVLLPRLDLLVPDQHRFKALLFQPQANLEYSPEFGVRNADRALAERQFSRFLELVAQSSAELASSPEYSCPWVCIWNALKEKTLPPKNKLWVLGCEALPVSGIKELREQCNKLGVVLLCEEGDTASGTKSFYDPVCFIFQATTKSGESCVVLVVQFKNEPMGDKPERFEADHLALGTVFYKFRLNSGNTISLLVLLCSDALLYAKAGGHPIREEIEREEPQLVLHLQLNPEPRYGDYAKYRQHCATHREHKDVICLNWARQAKITNAAKRKTYVWETTGVSAMYSKQWVPPVDSQGAVTAHQKGLYLTYWEIPRAHVAFLNFESLVFLLSLTKVSQADVLQAQRNAGLPIVLSVRGWKSETERFEEDRGAELVRTCDGASGTSIPCDLLKEYGLDADLVPAFANRPIDLERLVALATNRALLYKSSHSWPAIEAVESMVLSGSSETIRRITFVQDALADARDYRERTLKDFSDFNQARKSKANFPDHLKAFAEGNKIVSLESPHCVTLQASSGEAGLFVFDRATNTPRKAKERHQAMQDFLLVEKNRQSESRRAGNRVGEPDVDEERSLLWFSMAEDGGPKIHFYPEKLERRINDAGKAAPAPITEP